jgi:hypothetical protein
MTSRRPGLCQILHHYVLTRRDFCHVFRATATMCTKQCCFRDRKNLGRGVETQFSPDRSS